jgi:hypothetical protein
MTERHGLIAFLAILFAICYLATIAAILAARKQYAEALGFGGLTTGLVGVLGTFKPKSASDVTQNIDKATNVTSGESQPK